MSRAMPTGEKILRLARKHVGEKYVFGALAPKNNPHWTGPWDCAEFASWLVFQVAGKLYGCSRNAGDPATADAWTGFWARDAKSKGKRISVAQAARTPGAAVLRVPKGKVVGHIVLSDGQGGTVEAHSSKRGVIAHTLSNRRWDMGIRVPGIRYQYQAAVAVVKIKAPKTVIYRLKKPLMSGPTVKKIQRKLKQAGLHPGRLDARFGPKTQAAVVAFQASRGLVADGEVGPQTAKALRIRLPVA